MQLTKQNIANIKPVSGLTIPAQSLFELPEKVLQFGTGVLLRGLPDYFIDKANRQGIFNGRVVVVKSTNHGGTDAFTEQDGLYTLCVKGIVDDRQIDENIINTSISRVLSAKENWKAILACAHQPEMQIVISNTTEVGITYVEETIGDTAPISFPGKLLAFLLERYTFFNGSEESGMVIVPTELITDNGTKLKQIIIDLSQFNQLTEGFMHWLTTANQFCNSLVDRIVPGKLPAKEEKYLQTQLGYTDDLMIMAEPFRLWAIESDNHRVQQILSFSQVDEGVVIAPSIEKFKELKLRLLNGTHTFSCGLANLAGFGTVKMAMTNKYMSQFVAQLALSEIAPTVCNEDITYDEATTFANSVFDRFRNPYIEHQWKSIAVQFSLKMKMRNVPLIVRHYQYHHHVPELMALGFAAFLLFMKTTKNNDGEYEGRYNGTLYTIQDENAAWFAEQWQANTEHTIAKVVTADIDFWGADLSILPGFVHAVTNNIFSLIENGVVETINKLQLNKQIA